MTLFELIDIAQSIAGRIDVQWGFFLTIHMALLGGIVYVDRPLSRVEKVVAAVLYVTFAAFNYLLLRRQQELLFSAYTDIAALEGDPCCASSRTLQFYVQEVANGFDGRAFMITATIHIVAMTVVFLSIITDRAKPH